jgi:hypothetical protein
MLKPHSPSPYVPLLLIIVALCSTSYGQAAQPSQSATKPRPTLQTPRTAVVLTECEGINNCAAWKFFGRKGVGKWPTGEEAILEVTSLEKNHIVITRTDENGTREGVTTSYEGEFDGDDVGGKYAYDLDGQHSQGHWYWITGKTNIPLPNVMHLCIANCFTLELENGHYIGYSEGRRNPNSVWSVQTFTPESIILNRSEGGGGAAILTGKISNDTFTSMQGSQSWTAGIYKGNSGPFVAAWGASLESVPGTNADRDQRQFQPAPLSLEDAIRIGKEVRDGIQLLQFFSGLFQKPQ